MSTYARAPREHERGMPALVVDVLFWVAVLALVLGGAFLFRHDFSPCDPDFEACDID